MHKCVSLFYLYIRMFIYIIIYDKNGVRVVYIKLSVLCNYTNRYNIIKMLLVLSSRLQYPKLKNIQFIYKK